MGSDKIITLITIVASSFVAAFSSGIQKKSNRNDMTMLQLVSEICIHAVSGTIIGLLGSMFTEEIFSMCAIAAIGGLLGEKVVYFAWSFVKVAAAKAKNVDIKEISKMAEEMEKDEGNNVMGINEHNKEKMD